MLFLHVFIRSFFDPNASVCQYTVCATCNCAGGWVFKTVCAWLHVCLFNLSNFHVYTLYTCFSCQGLWVCLLLFFFFPTRLTAVCSIQRGKHDLHLDQSLSDTHTHTLSLSVQLSTSQLYTVMLLSLADTCLVHHTSIHTSGWGVGRAGNRLRFHNAHVSFRLIWSDCCHKR